MNNDRVSLWSVRLACSVVPACLSLAATGSAQEAADSAPVSRYQLEEEWSIAAQGPVHLREKQVKATYRLEVTDKGDDSEGQRHLQVKFMTAAVEADIPAQKRKAAFDSENQSPDIAVEDHELVHSIALSGQSLELTFAADGKLTGIAGLDDVTRRLDDIYDKELRGSEQDLNTRDFERERLSAEQLVKSWADLFLVPVSERQAEPERSRMSEVAFIACIPTESWMSRVTVPATETVRTTALSDGDIRIDKTATLVEPQRVEGRIGTATWTYEPREIKRETTQQVHPDGRVDSLSSSLTAVLATTLSIGTDIPIQMTIRHSTALSKK